MLLRNTFLQEKKMQCTQESSMVSPSPTHSTHRGAARQMYGSGSLRPPGSKPIYATGQRQRGVRTTISPSQNIHRKYIPIMQPYPILPVPIPLDEYERMASGYPMYFNPVLGMSANGHRATNRGGMYGGRPEYYQGRPPYGFSNAKFSFDPGLILGKTMSTDYNGRYTMHRNEDYDDLSENFNLKQPDEGEDGEIKMIPEHYGPECEENCPKGEIVCHKGCSCIEEAKRCDGKMDCEDNEDELDCGQIEHHQAKCDETKNYVLCPRTNRCISKDWLCDGDDDCGDYSDETHCDP
ncbi:hypothetical protein NQ318_006967 [Aromia moschata]|uniref:Uncharacterized protein n=1 Tax=Aromia moschata TaxID=1265417 RepID=A0AAV8Y800_9CUCU|nr:hypothetical protein NQ318_006967 [Aromia moschata]